MFQGTWLYDLTWMKIFELLVPIVACMWLVRWWEGREGVPRSADLSPAQKGWLFVLCLRPRAAAKLLQSLSESSRLSYMACGAALPEKSERLALEVVRAYWLEMPKKERYGDGSSLALMLWDLEKFCCEHLSEAVELFDKLFPLSQADISDGAECSASSDSATSSSDDFPEWIGDT